MQLQAPKTVVMMSPYHFRFAPETQGDTKFQSIANTSDEHACVLTLSIPTLETAGGSIPCMIAGIHLAQRTSEALQ